MDNKLPNGDIRRGRGDAANEAIVTSRDQAQQRVENTREGSATTTHGGDRYTKRAARGMNSGPSTGFEVFTPGRQGIRAMRDLNPAGGSADLY